MTRQRCGLLALCIVLALPQCCGQVAAQGKSISRVVFLHLRMKQGKVVLVDQTVRVGTLKPSRKTQEYATLGYDLLSQRGLVLWSGTMHDPSLRRYEYEDPARSGTLKNKQVVLDDVEFTVRIPDILGGDHVEFYRSLAPSVGSEHPVRRSIGTITLGAGRARQ